MNETKLLPCPFCGGEAIVSQDSDGYYVTCKNDCVVQMKSYLERESINAWNTRKPVERILERLEERQEDCYALYAIAFDPKDRDGFDAYSDAIEIVKEEVQYD